MANFSEAHKIVMRHEGGYANNPYDRGGETYKGIARKIHPTWPGWVIVDQVTSKTPLIYHINDALNADMGIQELVLRFYKDQFWDAVMLDSINNQAIATELYDTAVNMGTGTASLFLQRTLNVLNRNGQDYADLKLDGRVGPKTVDTTNRHPRPNDLLKVLNILQGYKYVSICEANPSQEIFMRGWLSRVSF